MMNDSRNSESDETTIIDVKRRFLSECTIPDVRILKKICSVPGLDSNTNYDDICGPWKFDNVPLHGQYSYQPFTLITSEDIAYMRQEADKELILLFLEKKIPRNMSHKGARKEIFVKLLWQIFEFFKEKLFTDQQICTVIELILSTHSFYLANYWNMIEETYNYFFQRVLLYTVMDPPKCIKMFTPNEAEIILKFFHEVYLQNIVLLHLVYMTHYCIVVRFDDRQ